MKSLKNNKAPGCDFITNEDIKQFMRKEYEDPDDFRQSEDSDSFEFSDVALNILFNVMQAFWKFEKIPSGLKRIKIKMSMIPKTIELYPYLTLSLSYTKLSFTKDCCAIWRPNLCYLQSKLPTDLESLRLITFSCYKNSFWSIDLTKSVKGGS